MPINNSFQTALRVAAGLGNRLDQRIEGVTIAQFYIAEIMHAFQNGLKKKTTFLTWRQALVLFGKRLMLNKITETKPFAVFNYVVDETHIKMSKPTVDWLQKNDIPVLFLTTKERLFHMLQMEGYSVQFTLGVKPVSLAVGAVNQLDKDTQVGLEVVKRMYPRTAFLTQEFTCLIKKYQPKYVLVGNDNIHEGRLMATIAKRHKIPTGSIQHGSLNTTNPLHGRSIVDHFFVYGEKAKRALVTLGKDPEEVVVAGWPLKQSQTIQEDIPCIIEGTSKIALVCLSGPGHSTSMDHHKAIIKAICGAFQNLDCKLIFKLHPKDRKANYEEVRSAGFVVWDNLDLSARQLQLSDLIQEAKIVLTGASTVGLEALLQYKNVVTVDLMNEYAENDFIKDGLTQHVTDAIQLSIKVKQLLEFEASNVALDNSNIHSSLESYYHKHFDPAFSPSEFIAQQIKKCVE